MKVKNIIQFTPYFPPHVGGLEKVASDIDVHWNFGKTIIVSGDVGQKETNVTSHNYFFLPSYEIIPNFPIPMIWKKEFREKYTTIRNILDKKEEYIVLTHTRFFLMSFLGGLFAKRHKLKWVHIEHGSEYVQLSSKIKNKIAYFYDKTLGKWVIKKADKVITISKAAENFVRGEFNRKDVETWYRGVDFPKLSYEKKLKKLFPNKTIIGYVGRLYKWKNVESLIKAYYNIKDSNLQLVIVGDGEDLERLKRLDTDNLVYFTGGVEADTAYSFQSEFDIHIHPSSPGGGLATTLLQAMNLGLMIVATPYEGANEVIINNKNGILLNDNSCKELQRGIELGINELNKRDIYARYNKAAIHEKFELSNTMRDLYNIL